MLTDFIRKIFNKIKPVQRLKVEGSNALPLPNPNGDWLAEVFVPIVSPRGDRVTKMVMFNARFNTMKDASKVAEMHCLKLRDSMSIQLTVAFGLLAKKHSELTNVVPTFQWASRPFKQLN